MNKIFFVSENDSFQKRSIVLIWKKLNLDPKLLVGVLSLVTYGFIILYSASNQNLNIILRQIVNLILSLVVMCIFAHIPIYRYKAFAPWLYSIGIFMLLAVMGVGVVSKGAQRWLNLGLLRFQPSEIMKFAIPMMLAWYLQDKELPLRLKELFVSCIIIIVPMFLIAKQPDLSTALLVLATGGFVIILAGISWRLIIELILLALIIIPIGWHFMHDYQRERLFTFLTPEYDPLGSGYNIIQSKIAIGSGGWFGKGWLLGSQAHLQFLPEHTTDFIFAVCGEEFGLFGCIFLIGIFLYIVGYGLYISINAHDTFSRLLVGSLILSFFSSFFINIGMTTGILPVIGIPLPLISYGGSSLITYMASFGIIMAVKKYKIVVPS